MIIIGGTICENQIEFIEELYSFPMLHVRGVCENMIEFVEHKINTNL
jgi:hypothetical protein